MLLTLFPGWARGVRAVSFTCRMPHRNEENEAAPRSHPGLTFSTTGFYHCSGRDIVRSSFMTLKTAWDLNDFFPHLGEWGKKRGTWEVTARLCTSLPQIWILPKREEYGRLRKLTENSFSAEIMLAGYLSISLGEERKKFALPLLFPTPGTRPGRELGLVTSPGLHIGLTGGQKKTSSLIIDTGAHSACQWISGTP